MVIVRVTVCLWLSLRTRFHRPTSMPSTSWLRNSLEQLNDVQTASAHQHARHHSQKKSSIRLQSNEEEMNSRLHLLFFLNFLETPKKLVNFLQHNHESWRASAGWSHAAAGQWWWHIQLSSTLTLGFNGTARPRATDDLNVAHDARVESHHDPATTELVRCEAVRTVFPSAHSNSLYCCFKCHLPSTPFQTRPQASRVKVNSSVNCSKAWQTRPEGPSCSAAGGLNVNRMM